jgi:PKMT, C-terminal winged helix domain/Predicted methyltransferase regulatory domain
VASAREFLRTLPHGEAAALADSPDDILFHDILAPCFHPVWFHEFAAHARDHGLRYLGEADPHDMFDESGRLVGEAGEQELDFRRLRRFRQTLLCRAEAPLKRAIARKQMDGFLFTKSPHGRRIAGDDRAVEAVAQALEDVHPLPVMFEELIPYAGSRKALREILVALVAGGCADLHVHDFPCEESVTELPCGSRLARYQAATNLLVTNLCHVPVQLDEVARQLLLLLDGTRSQATLARRLAALPGAGSAKAIQAALPRSLEWMARMALLEG